MPRTCSIEGCDGPHAGRGWCSKHYMRWRRWGDPERIDPRLVNGVQRIPLSDIIPARRELAIQSQRRFDNHPLTIAARR